MRDSEVVASIVAGDPEGLATAYDRYADPLCKYCRTLVSDPAEAADAVQDTFVIAVSRLDGLRDPDRFRAWLYTVARNESLRILRARKGTSAPDEAPGVNDESADVGEPAERGDLRTLLDNAAEGLNPGEREVIELQLRQGLESAEVARVLGVSRHHAHAMLSRARDQLEACLAVLLVGRAGRDDCVELGSMLPGWDGRLTVLLHKRVHLHIEHCATCSARRAFEMRPVMLLGLSPAAALATGALASFRLANGVPAGLKAHTIALATGHEAEAVAHRAAVLSHAGAFTRHGFPKPVHGAGKAVLAHHAGAGGAKGTSRSSPQGQAAVAAAVVLAVIIAALSFALTASTGSPKPTADPRPPVLTHALPSASARVVASPVPQARRRRPTPTTPAPPATTAAPTTAPVTPTPAPSKPRPTPSPTASPTKPHPTPTPTKPSPSRAPTGALAMEPRGGPLVVRGDGASIYMFAAGGTVNWSATVSNDPGGAINVSPSSGILTAASPTTTVTVTASQFVPCDSGSSPVITIDPGGTQYFVCTGRVRPFSGHGHGHGHGKSPPG